MFSRTISQASLFAVVLSGALTAAGTARAEPPKPKDGPLGMKFVRMMKSEGYDKDEIAIYTVTQGQWQELMGNNPSHFSRTGAGKDKVKDITDADLKQFPVEKVSWDDAREFIKKLNEKERGSGWTYRLPDRIEWQYACVGGVPFKEGQPTGNFYFDKPTNDLSSDQANFNGEKPSGNAPKGKWLGRTTKVGSYQPNQLGLYDMHGNVWQWCDDIVYFKRTPLGRRFTGGSWATDGDSCRVFEADEGVPVDPSTRREDVGFRLVRVPSNGK